MSSMMFEINFATRWNLSLLHNGHCFHISCIFRVFQNAKPESHPTRYELLNILAFMTETSSLLRPFFPRFLLFNVITSLSTVPMQHYKINLQLFILYFMQIECTYKPNSVFNYYYYCKQALCTKQHKKLRLLGTILKL